MHSVDLDQLLKDLDVEDFIASLGVDYKNTTGKSGPQLNIKECPRCGGSSWKVFLNAETGVGCCFHGSCSDHPGLNVFSFAKAICGGVKQAIEELSRYSEQIGWKPKRQVRVSPPKPNCQIPESIALPHRGKMPAYLKQRGFTGETAKHFEWRYSKDGAFEYLDVEGKKRRQRYDNRIILPVRDLNGVIQTFQGRDTTGKHEKKYLFPPGLPGTGCYLYNSHRAVGAEELVIGEGVMDVAAIHQAFAVDALLSKVIPVGTFGKVLSEGQANGSDQLGALLLLKSKGLKRVTMMWDSESVTIRAAIKAAMRLEAIGLHARVAVLPADKDPNEVEPHEVRAAFRAAFRATKTNAMKYLSSAAKTYI